MKHINFCIALCRLGVSDKMAVRSVLLLIALYSFVAHGQTKFDKGYIIRSGGERIDCYVRNGPATSNPSRVEYRESPDGPIKIQNISEVQEFAIDSVAIYKRFTVKIDRSLNDANRLSLVKDPEFKTETLFLRVLIAGAANLYEYIDGNLVRYFFDTKDHLIDQLIFKKYMFQPTPAEFQAGQRSGMATNNKFRQQLQSFVPVAAGSDVSAAKTEYSRPSLVKYFLAAQSGVQPPQQDNFVEKSNKNVFKENGSKILALRLQGGANIEQISFYIEPNGSNLSSSEADISSSAGLRAGTEIEIIIPSRANFWSILLSPTYSKIHSEGTIRTTDGFFVSHEMVQHLKIEYQELELAIGARFGIFLGRNSKIFANACGGIAMLNKYILKYEVQPDFKVNQSAGKNIQGGLGYEYKKFSIEGRMLGKKKLGINYYNTSAIGFALILGYNFL